MGLPHCISNKLVNTARTVSKNQCQIKLLKNVLSNSTLMSSKIISSVNPKIGKRFPFTDLQCQADSILEHCRQQLLEISVKDAERTFTNNQNKLACLKQSILHDPLISATDVNSSIKKVSSKTEFTQSKKHDKKTLDLYETVYQHFSTRALRFYPFGRFRYRKKEPKRGLSRIPN